MRIRRGPVVALLAACLAGATALPAAASVDIDDPDIFGPGEAWPMPQRIEPGDGGPWVNRLQERLSEAGFRPGAPDGTFGQATLGAVYAFQKLHRLDRTGSFEAASWDLLDQPITIERGGEDDRVEVDLDRQVLILVRDATVEAVLPISSGNGETYIGSAGRPVRATTPEGSYSFYRHVDGWRISYLGGLYRPFYFRGGYAIHGSYSVPPYPASHGCIRVELADMDYLTTQLEIGMPIYVYGNRLSRSDVIETTVNATRSLQPGMPIDPPVSPSPV